MPVKYYMLDYMPNKYIKYLITMLLTVMSLTTHAEKTVFSLVTHYQTEKAVYTAWGHSALRIKNDSLDCDWIYNYGLFSFGDYTKFVYNFVLGRTDYMVGSQRFINSFPADDAQWQAIRQSLGAIADTPENYLRVFNSHFQLEQ